MTSWNDVKNKLQEVFTGLVAELPAGDDGDTVDATVRRVFREPPQSIEAGNLPCIVLGESTLEDEWEPQAVSETYTLTASLLLRDEDKARAVEWAEAWREVIKNVIRDQIKIGMPYVVLNGASYGAIQDITFAGLSFDGFQFTFPINISQYYEFKTGDAA